MMHNEKAGSACKSRIYILAGVSLVCLLIIMVIILQQVVARWNAAARNRVSTLNALRTFSLALQLHCEEVGEAPPTDMDGLLKWLPEHVKGQTWAHLYRTDLRLCPHAILDMWDTPIRIVAVSPRSYEVMSLGRNRKDDGGSGDDIVYEFDPFEYMRQSSLADANTE